MQVNLIGKSDLKVQVKIPKLKKLGLKPRQIDEALKILVDDIKDRTPYDTGKLYRSIRKRKTADGGQIYINGKRNNEVAGYQHFGTKKHWVRPKGKKPLAWITAGGTWAYSMGHKVKGIKATKFFKPSRKAIREFAQRISTFLKARG